MNSHFNERETYTPPNHEKIEVIGREMPLARDMYESLSEEKNILVRSEALSDIRQGSAVKEVSERELFDNLLEFCAACKEINVGEESDEYGYNRAIRETDTFLDSMTFLSKEMYKEAADGLALRHSEWLANNPESNIIFTIPDNRLEKSQAAVASDIISRIDLSVSERVQIAAISKLDKDDITSDTKLVLTDDWSLTGNHLSNDAAYLAQHLRAREISTDTIDIEVNLLIARKEQVNEGVSALERSLSEDYVEYNGPAPKIVAYFEAPVTYGKEASPTGSHSATDYGFSQTLSRMLTVAQRHNKAEYMPYIAMIVPEYSWDYDRLRESVS